MASTMAHPTKSSQSFYVQRPQQQKKMSITQTYYLAHTARGKLSKEAARADHDLRLLVGHANLLDSLMLELANAEKEQERWFNQTVRSASKSSQDKHQHIRWADTIVEDSVEDWDPEDDSDSDSDMSDDSDYEEEDLAIRTASATPIRRAPSPVAIITEQELSDSGSDEDDDEPQRLSLTRSPSRQSPPELLDDLSSDSEEESMPPSPTQVPIDSFTTEKQASVSTQAIYHGQPVKRADLGLTDPEQYEEGYYQHPGTMIEVY